MTETHCPTCGRELAGPTAFCPFCGADRRLTVSPGPVSAPAEPSQPAPELHAPSLIQPSPATAVPASSPEVLASSAPETAEPATSPSKALTPRKKGGCGLQLLLALMLVAALLGWCAVRTVGSRGALPVAGAVASRPLHLSRRWRSVRLPEDAPDGARFALSTDTALRVRAEGRTYAVQPNRPLQLPEGLSGAFEMRAADYVSADAATGAQVTLSTLPPR